VLQYYFSYGNFKATKIVPISLKKPSAQNKVAFLCYHSFNALGGIASVIPKKINSLCYCHNFLPDYQQQVNESTQKMPKSSDEGICL
jgi:hypothetical protein